MDRDCSCVCDHCYFGDLDSVCSADTTTNEDWKNYPEYFDEFSAGSEPGAVSSERGW
jgi:hypothetical protein